MSEEKSAKSGQYVHKDNLSQDEMSQDKMSQDKMSVRTKCLLVEHFTSTSTLAGARFPNSQDGLGI